MSSESAPATKSTYQCHYCKVEKAFPEEFTSIRGKKLVNCIRCRDKLYAQRRKYLYGTTAFRNPKKNDSPPTKKEVPEPIQQVCYPPEIEIPELTEYIEIMKHELQPKLGMYSKKKILQFFENSEPEISTAMEHIESKELKDLIKIYMNTKYLESVR